jgi:hypothetical protein
MIQENYCHGTLLTFGGKLESEGDGRGQAEAAVASVVRFAARVDTCTHSSLVSYYYPADVDSADTAAAVVGFDYYQCRSHKWWEIQSGIGCLTESP